MTKLILLLAAILLVGFGLSLLTSDQEPSENHVSQGRPAARLESEGEPSPLGNAGSPTGPGGFQQASREGSLEDRRSSDTRSDDREPLGKPLPFNTTVERRVIDEETGEEEIWKLTKRNIAYEDLPDRVLPAPRPREEEANADTESARALDGMALEAWKRGEIARAMELFEEAVKADPDDARARSDYGRLLTLMAAYDKAYPHYKRAAELEPDDAAVWLDLKTLYERDSQFERAHHADARARELAPGQEFVKDENGFYRLPGYTIIP